MSAQRRLKSKTKLQIECDNCFITLLSDNEPIDSWIKTVPIGRQSLQLIVAKENGQNFISIGNNDLILHNLSSILLPDSNI